MPNQWRRGGTPIGGAIAATYTVAIADIGAMITAVVIARNAGGGASAESNQIGPISGA